jgi:putative FmdB family regulatory protein
VGRPYTLAAMPTYEYRCRDCGHTFEIVQRMSDDTLTVCPNCDGELRKVFTPPAISFKGSGFYATDHGKKAKRSADGKSDTDTKTDTKAPKKESSSSDTKPETSGGAATTTKKESSS